MAKIDTDALKRARGYDDPFAVIAKALNLVIQDAQALKAVIH